jgi:hypothetical protein
MAKKFYTGDGYSAGLGLAGSTQKIVLKIQAYAVQGGQIGVRMCIRQEGKAKYQTFSIIAALRHAIFIQCLDEGVKCLPRSRSILGVRKFEATAHVFVMLQTEQPICAMDQ